METLEAIHTRRSIRKFTSQPVAPETVKELLAAAMSAPSACNDQSWQFIVIDERIVLDALPGISPFAGMCREAPLAILVCGDTRQEKCPGFWVQNCSAATQNLLLAAHDLGLGAVWTGVYPSADRVEDFRKLMEVPDGVIPLALIPIGYPDQQVPPEDRYRADRVHYNHW